MLENCKILVTGACGFIGGHLLAALEGRKGVEIAALCHNKAPNNKDVQDYRGDVRDLHFVRESVLDFGPDYIFHLAATKPRTSDPSHFHETISTNVLGSLNILQTATELSGLKSLVLIGTIDEYGDALSPFCETTAGQPANIYGLSKYITSQISSYMFEHHHVPCIMLRPSLAYGPGQDADMFLPALIIALLNDEHFPMTKGAQTRDLIYIDDLVQALLVAAQNRKALGRIINIGCGEPISLREIVTKVECITGKTGLAQMGAIEYRPGEIMDYAPKIDIARKVLSWSPQTSIDEGLALTIEYYRNKATNAP